MKNINRTTRAWYYLMTKTRYRKYFTSIGKKSIIFTPIQMDSKKSIQVGDNVFVAQGAWFNTINREGATLFIDNGTVIGHFCHIAAHYNISIGKNVLVADKVFISDCSHGYENINHPIINQEIKFLNEVKIGDGSHSGENVCILGANIGKHCVIGSNSVVTKEIPDYSVACGVPAKVIKKYDFDRKCWIKTN